MLALDDMESQGNSFHSNTYFVKEAYVSLPFFFLNVA